MDKKEWIPEYIKKLEDETVSFFDVVKFVQQYMPSKLYSYKKINAHWKENIFEGCVHLTPASDFNDPFDCFPIFDFEHSNSRIAEAYKEFMRNFQKEKDEIDGVVDELSANNQTQTAVSCFTERFDSMLMWSYYTDNHKGICIEYDTNKNWIFNSCVLPVIYKKERYDATRILETQNVNIVMNPYFYKAEYWKHEEEWRVVLPTNTFKNNNLYLKEAISAVYLGAKINPDIEKEIKEWGESKEIPIHKMKLSEKNYELIEK